MCTRQRVAPLRFAPHGLVTLYNETLSATSGFTKMLRFSKPLLQASASDEPYMYLAPKQTALVVCTMTRNEQSDTSWRNKLTSYKRLLLRN